MSEPCLSIPLGDNDLEPFEDRIDILFHELELATKWQRPSVLLAIYSSEYVRADADIALENRLHNLGQSTYHIKIKNQKSADVSLLISELANLNNVVFFVEGLRWGAGEDDCCTYRTLNKSREFFIENQIRVVFWLTENEAIDLAHYAPDYWSFRHRVIEFVDSPKPEQISPHVLESTWQGMGEFINTTEDLDAKIALRTALLTDLPNGNESTSARANLLLTLGILHWRRGDYERASQFLNKALDLAARLEDNRFEALCFNAIALVETDLGRIEEAIQAYQNAINLAPEQISPWNNLGNLYRKLERHEEALAAFQKAIEQNASDAVGWNGLGDLYHELGRNDDAMYAFLKAIEFSPNYAHSWNGLGNSYLDEDQLDEALAAHLKAIEIDRNTVDSWFALGDIYMRQGKNENAGMAYRTAIEFDPKNAQAWNKLGDLHYNTGANEEAMHAYQKAVDSNQSCNLSYSNLASLYVHKGCHAEAIPLLQKGIELSEDITDTMCLWNRLGDAYRCLEDYDNSMAAYRKADSLDLKTVFPETESSSSESDLELASSEDISTQSGSNLEPENMQKETLNPESAEPSIVCPSDNMCTSNDTDTISTQPEAEFMDWLDGLASAMSVFQQPESTGATGSSLISTGPKDEIEGTPEMQSIQLDAAEKSMPEAAFPPFNADEPIPPVNKDTASSNKPSRVFPDSPPLPDTPVKDEPDNTTHAETPNIDDPTSQRSMADTGNTSQADAAIEAENAHIWNELGNIYYNTGANDEAVHAFEKAIELDRSYGWSYNNLASLYFHQGRYADAVPLYQKGLQFLGEAKDKALLWNRLGDAYRRLDEHDKAAAAYRKAIELDPDSVSLLTRARFSLLGNCRT
jgi:tetratricopeptide (TPR) repeat protein